MEQKKLYRDTDRGVIGGVLAGLANYYGHDVVLWRLVAIILLVLTGLMPGALIYVLAWIIIPAGSAVTYTVNESDDAHGSRQ